MALRRIWTRAYRPFIMGGDVNAPIYTEVEATDPVDVGQDIQCFLVVAPNGRTFAAESETGAIVGDSIDAVKADMAEADPAVVAEQMAEALFVNQGTERTRR